MLLKTTPHLEAKAQYGQKKIADTAVACTARGSSGPDSSHRMEKSYEPPCSQTAVFVCCQQPELAEVVEKEVVVYGGYEKFSGSFLSALGTAALVARKETPS